ncbi:hypothetical protein [Clostridium thailandense]|uniref:hypothetical protein n=1 Tax=Clostridium thailandense TaxID=2794346 RepID=UPI003988BDB1
MNYVWDLVIKAKALGIPKEKLKFSAAETYSPYMELSNAYINSKLIEEEVELNPYYRFYEIFKDMFSLDNEENLEVRNTLFDILIHFLTDMDLKQGMNKKEYYIKFILQDIKKDVFGKIPKEDLEFFNEAEQDMLAGNILRLYITGQSLYLLKDSIRKLFKHSMIYVNCEEKDELLFYIGEEKKDEKLAKLEFVKEIFLPIKFNTKTYWKNHFGVIDVNETMTIGSIVIY